MIKKSKLMVHQKGVRIIKNGNGMNGKVLNNFKVKGRGTQMNLMIQEMGTFKTLR